jgi:hypothetical protein
LILLSLNAELQILYDQFRWPALLWVLRILLWLQFSTIFISANSRWLWHDYDDYFQGIILRILHLIYSSSSTPTDDHWFLFAQLPKSCLELSLRFAIRLSSRGGLISERYYISSSDRYWECSLSIPYHYKKLILGYEHLRRLFFYTNSL